MAIEHAGPGDVIDVRPLGPGLREADSRTLIRTTPHALDALEDSSLLVTILIIRRSQKLFVAQWASTGALNGHVPRTVLLSDIALSSALIPGCAAGAMSNEPSASAANLVVDGWQGNQDDSKSFVGEGDLAR